MQTPPPVAPRKLSKTDFVHGRTSATQLLDSKKLISSKNARATHSSKALSEIPPMPAIKTRTLELNIPKAPRPRRYSDTRAVIVRPKPASRLSDEINLTPEFLDRIRKSVNTINKEQMAAQRRQSHDEEEEEQLPNPRIDEYTIIMCNGKPVFC